MTKRSDERFAEWKSGERIKTSDLTLEERQALLSEVDKVLKSRRDRNRVLKRKQSKRH